MASSIRTCLWFRDGRGREAAEFYCSLIPGSRIEKYFAADAEPGAFSVIDFSLGGVPYQILDAGPVYTLTEAVSISVATDDQAESDRLTAALTANGGEQGQCGWLKDRYGVSWQIYPKRLAELTMSADKTVSTKAMEAMMKQTKIDISAIEAAIGVGSYMSTVPSFAPGNNIAMKVPAHQYEATLRFYRDVVRLKEITTHLPSVGFEFGSKNLWIDSVPHLSQAEVWLEIVTNDINLASEHLKSAGVVRCDEIEPLPDGFQAFWISSPSSIVHLVCKDSESW